MNYYYYDIISRDLSKKNIELKGEICIKLWANGRIVCYTIRINLGVYSRLAYCSNSKLNEIMSEMLCI